MCELFGLILVLFASAWQIFIEVPVSNLNSSMQPAEMEEKLDRIWLLLTDDYTHQHTERAGFMATTNVKELNLEWKYGGDEKNSDLVEIQAKIVNWISAIIFLIGSCLLVFAKFLELRSVSGASIEAQPDDG